MVPELTRTSCSRSVRLRVCSASMTATIFDSAAVGGAATAGANAPSATAATATLQAQRCIGLSPAV
jgi:hypothetical protein